VYWSKLAAHFGADGTLAAVESSCWPDVRVAATPRIGPKSLSLILRKAAAQAPGFEGLERRMRGRKGHAFPMMQSPRLVIYPWEGRFRLAWTAYAFSTIKGEDPTGAEGSTLDLKFGQVFVDASTGELFLFSPAAMHVAGAGSAVTPVVPVGGPYAVRNLNVNQVGSSGDYELRDTTHAREIITFDMGCNAAIWTDGPYIAQALKDGAAPISTNTGGTSWTTALTNPPSTTRTDSQQPEVDAHFFCGEAYEWYEALGAAPRAGWDDNKFVGKVETNMPVRVLTHVPKYDGGVPTCQSAYSRFDVQPVPTPAGSLLLVPFLVLCDGDPALTWSGSPGMANRSIDFLAGSKMLVGHEYQHCITMFSFNHGGNPGIGYSGWTAAVHEGLSDVFGCLFSETWAMGPDISKAGLVIRNLAYPRDPWAWENLAKPYPQGLGHSNKDHFADKGLSNPPVLLKDAYDHGTILAHCAYLMGGGGVHERLARSPALIPVQSMGFETVSGKTVLRAGRIWYVGLKDYSATLANDEGSFRVLRQACVNAAIQLYGVGTVEHRTTELAFYAVGLQPPGTSYGADVTFLRWGWDWRHSRPYLGGIYANSPDWASLDLFINNGGGPSGWTAVIDPGTLASPPENQVYCRVRNVGDLDAAGVTVEFWYAKISAVPGPWTQVTDKNGVAQKLTIGALGAGQMTFGDTQVDQDAPPGSAMIKWYIPPLAPSEVVNHFCLKAVVTSTNDVNAHNDEVQSNIAYLRYLPSKSNPLRFWNEEILRYPGPFETVMDIALPHRWHVHGPTPDPAPAGPEGHAMALRIEMPRDARGRIEAPFDGRVVGRLSGPLSGGVHGGLTGVVGEPERLGGRIALALEGLGTVLGGFSGRLDPYTGAVRGHVTGVFQNAATGRSEAVGVWLDGQLEPWRRINVSQRVDGRTVGGFTVEIYGGVPGTPEPAPGPRGRRVASD
jgi:hypothetical protein